MPDLFDYYERITIGHSEDGREIYVDSTSACETDGLFDMLPAEEPVYKVMEGESITSGKRLTFLMPEDMIDE
ncbi:hypothetical protein ACFL3V_04805 [Nanoarchaeota archaeon]